MHFVSLPLCFFLVSDKLGADYVKFGIHDTGSSSNNWTIKLSGHSNFSSSSVWPPPPFDRDPDDSDDSSHTNLDPIGLLNTTKVDILTITTSHPLRLTPPPSHQGTRADLRFVNPLMVLEEQIPWNKT